MIDDENEDKDEIQFTVKIDDDVLYLKNKFKNDIKNLPWVEKYRPTLIENIIGNKNIKEALGAYLKQKTLPHLLLHGPSGTGKTSIINSYAKQAYGDYYNMMVLQINASEERGIEIIRNKVKNFVISKCIYKVQPFKLVILDEADSMTFSAQSMLRRIIEDYTENARFCLICNKVKNIDMAIQSRCTQFKFSNLSKEDMKKGIISICMDNKIKYTDDGIDFLIKISRGDMRKAINNLQSINMSYNIINYENVCIFFGYPSIEHINKIYEIVTKNNLQKSYELIRKIIFDNQYSFLEIVNETHNFLLNKFLNNKLEYNKFSLIINKLKNLEYNIYICPLDELVITAYVACYF
jgi:replication factor C subunit 3/5